MRAASVGTFNRLAGTAIVPSALYKAKPVAILPKCT